MALVNPNIALGIQPVQLADPMAQYGRIAQFQAAQNQNALAQYQLGAAKRGEETQNVLAQAYAQSVDPTTGKIDYNKLTSLVAGGGGGAQLPGIEKTRREVETAGLTQQKAQSDLLDSKLKQSRGFLDTIDPADPTAPAKYLAWHEANHRDPVIGAALTARGVSAEQARQSIEAAIAKGPAAFAQMVAQSKLGTEKFMEMNKPTFVQAGGEQVPTSGLTGQRLTNVPAIPQVPLPPAVVAQKKEIAGAGANRQTMQVNTMLPASEEAQKEFTKEIRQTYSALKQAPTVLDNIEKAKALVPQAKGFMGAGGESVLQAASFLNNRLGTSIDTKGVTSAEELRSRLFLGIMDNLKKLDSQPSQQQQAALQVALGSIGTDPTALPRVLDVFGETIRQKVDLYNEEVQSAEGRGVKFPYNPVIKLQSRPIAGGAGAGAARPAGVGTNWTLERDAAGNTAWVSPDRKSFKEAK